MNNAICTVPVAPLRMQPAHQSEMISQVLFGECLSVLEQTGEWCKVRGLYDGYEGWLTFHLITPTEISTEVLDVKYIASDLINEISFSNQKFYIPMGASLPFFNESNSMLWDVRYIYNGKYKDIHEIFNSARFRETLLQWLHAPYFWGGKTLMGVDCSGFVQTVFKVFGIRLKRDAWQQAEQGRAVDCLLHSQFGDLAFFKNKNERIVHVGILLNTHEIIHASGKVRIDTINGAGRSTKSRTERSGLLR